MSETTNWHIVKRPSGQCEIVPEGKDQKSGAETWGPFASQNEAIAKRVGLIRAGKCKPA